MNTQNPYKSWEIQSNKFPKDKPIEEQNTFLVRYALLAPNAHNTQPWKFIAEGAHIKILPNFQRALSYSDRTHREMYISLGCTLGNILIAAAYFNLNTKVKYLPEDDIENVAVRIEVSRNSKKTHLQQLFPFIKERRTNRFPYMNKQVPSSILDDFKNYNDEAGLEICFITDEDTKRKIVEIVKKASEFIFNDHIFKDELSQWVRSVYTKRLDGIPLFDFGIPAFITPFASFMIRNIPGKIQSIIDKHLFKTAPVFLVILSSNDNREAWLKAGKIFEYIAVACTKENVAVAPWAGAIEHIEANQQIRKILETKKYPLFFARIGYTKKIPHHSPRHPLEDVLA